MKKSVFKGKGFDQAKIDELLEKANKYHQASAKLKDSDSARGINIVCEWNTSYDSSFDCYFFENHESNDPCKAGDQVWTEFSRNNKSKRSQNLFLKDPERSINKSIRLVLNIQKRQENITVPYNVTIYNEYGSLVFETGELEHQVISGNDQVLAFDLTAEMIAKGGPLTIQDWL